MNGPNSSRWLALTGPLFTVVFVIVGFGLLGSTPGEKASAQKVVDYYSSHQGRATAAALLAPLGAAILVLFGSYLRARAREAGATGVGPTVLIGGVVLWGSGLLIGSTFGLTLVSASDHKQLQVAQTANVLSNDAWLPFVAGIAVTMLGAGMTVLSTRILPRWLGWVALVVGVVALLGPGGFAGFFIAPLWLLVAGIMLWMSSAATAVPPATAAAP
jgi:hypothetical protein